MTTPQSKWQRHAAKQTKPSNENLEIGWGKRLDKVRAPQLQNGEITNRFGDSIDRSTEETFIVDVAPPAKPTRIGQTTLDAKTQEARAAYEQSRQDEKAKKARVARDQQIASLVSEEDFRAILVSWAQKHEADLYPSQFNLTNIANTLLICLDQNADGITGLNSASLETCFQWMKAQTAPPLLEPPPNQRRRGEMAARRVDYIPAQTAPEPLSQRTVQRTVVTRQENQELRSKDFDQLQADARKGFKPANGRVV